MVFRQSFDSLICFNLRLATNLSLRYTEKVTTKRLPPTIHTLVLLFTLALSYFWISIPTLAHYSLQAVAFSVLLFFIIKTLNKRKIHHLIPQYATFEVALITFIFTLLISATGNTNSIFYPLIYIYLFLLVFSTYTQTAIMTTLGLMFYQYALMPLTNQVELLDYVSLPIILIFFLFSKQQHEAVIKDEKLLKNDSRTNLELKDQLNYLATNLRLTQQKLMKTEQLLMKTKQIGVDQAEPNVNRLSD